MILRSAIVLLYILSCALLRARPWRYFQLNADYFNQSMGLFSKQEINDLIPLQWRLTQFRDDGITLPEQFPVFVKPEWGQNSIGVFRIEDAKQLNQFRSVNTNNPTSSIIQQPGTGTQEIEIFFVDTGNDPHLPSLMSITHVVNDSSDRLPVNSIYNPHSHYCDITQRLDNQQRLQLWQHLKRIGKFRIARVGVRTECLEELIAGKFKVIEVNLFVPFPLSFLCPHMGWRKKTKLMLRMVWSMAQATKELPKHIPSKSIFFTKWRLSWQLSRKKGA